MAKNYTEQEVAGLLHQRLAEVGITEIQNVTLGALIEGKKRVAVSGVADEVYVTRDNRSWVRVKRGSANVRDQYGKHVKVGRVAGRSYLQLLDPDYDASPPSGKTETAGTIPHAPQHVFNLHWRQAPGPGDVSDPLYMPSRQLTDFLIVPHQGMQAGVLAGVGAVGNAPISLPNGALLDALTASIPAVANQAAVCRVELSSAGVVSVSVGATYTEPVTEQQALENAPGRSANTNTLGYIWLINGMSAIGWEHILPAPIAERTGGLGRINPFPPNVVVDDDGRLVLDDNGQIVFDDSEGPVYPPQPPAVLNFASDGAAYIILPVTATFSVARESGTGTITYDVALSSAPTVFNSATLPITIASGDILRVSAASVVTYKAVALTRTR